MQGVSKVIFNEVSELSKLERLLELDGVGIPTASAILTVIFPDKYAIIDIRCIEMLNDIGVNIKKTITKNRWREYLKIMRDLANENSLTPRQVDQILFSMHREMKEKDNYKNLY